MSQSNPTQATGAIALADGQVFLGRGSGAAHTAIGELCFNTAMTGHQEILADPSYAGQVVCFTFPHVGNVGANAQDEEAACEPARKAAVGMVSRATMTPPANWRAETGFEEWLRARGIVAVTGIDTRALTRRIREKGMVMCAIAHDPAGNIDIEALKAAAASAPDMEGRELAAAVARTDNGDWNEGKWSREEGYAHGPDDGPRVVVLDYGVKANILRLLTGAGARVAILPGKASFEEIKALDPDGVVFSNGPGDPAETGKYALPTIRAVIEAGIPAPGHLPGAPDAGAGTRREDRENAPGASRRQPSGEKPRNRPGRDRVDESRLCRGWLDPAGQRRRDPRLPVRRFELRLPPDRQAGLGGATPPGSQPRSTGQFRRVRPFRRRPRKTARLIAPAAISAGIRTGRRADNPAHRTGR